MSKKWQGIVLGIMCFLLVMSICVQVKTVNNNGTTISDNQEINDLKDQVLRMKEKYEISYEKLERAEEELERTRNNVASNNQELQELEEEIKKANTLLGYTDVSGSGVEITVTDAVVSPNSLASLYSSNDLIVHDVDVLAIVNELKNAGAEAIEVNGQRIVNTSAIVCSGNVISINGEKVTSPFTIKAIGFPELMATLERSGGYLEKLEESYITTTFDKRDKVYISKYSGVVNFKYAKTSK